MPHVSKVLFTIGFPIAKRKGSGDVGGYHCWAWFAKNGHWVPVDISEAIKHPEKKDYFFGRLDPNRVAFTIGRDIQIQTSSGTDELNYFIYPLALIDQKPADATEHKFTFRDL